MKLRRIKTKIAHTNRRRKKRQIAAASDLPEGGACGSDDGVVELISSIVHYPLKTPKCPSEIKRKFTLTQFYAGSFIFEDDSILHNEANIEHGFNFNQRIAFNGDNVGKFSGNQDK